MKPRARVLVVDDERSMQEFLEIFLRGEGYEVATAGDTAIALRRVRGETAPDLVVVRAGGLEIDASEIVRAIASIDGTSVVVTTAPRTSGRERADWLELGARAALPEPVDADELVAVVRRVTRTQLDQIELRQRAERLMEADRTALVASGAFIHASPSDPIHWGRGKVSVYQRTVFLEPDFEVGPGPKYHVYLVPKAGIRASSDLTGEMFVDLGRLRAFKGSQRYEIPAGVDLAKYQSVIIWCEQFGVLISPADLSAKS